MKKKLVVFTLGILLLGKAQSQTYFSDDFNDYDISDWVMVDNDSDPPSPEFSFVNEDEWFLFAGQFNGSIMSASQSFDMVTNYNPDNFIISPAIDLTSAQPTGLSLIFTSKPETFGGMSFAGIADHYAVYVTSDTTLANVLNLTPVFETTIATTDPEYHLIDISAYAGQNVHLVFRHFDCTGQGIFSIDDVVVKTVFPNDISIQQLDLNRYALVGVNNTLAVSVKNEGSTPITSLQLNWNDGTDHIQTINGLAIDFGEVVTINHPTTVNYASPVEKTLAVTISQPNGSVDPFPTNNNSSALINTVSQIAPKKVVVEEGTGTWCGNCPRGAVALEYMEITYSTNFIGIAVHGNGNDPMEDTAYVNGADFLAYPSVNIDREIIGVDASIDEIESIYTDRIELIAPASISASCQGSGSTAIIDVTTTFHTPFLAANYRIGVIISEDNVTGTTSDYDQHNYYSWQINNSPLFGAGHNWQTSPEIIPAAEMEYDHVGRALLGGYAGQVGSVPATISDGQVVNYTFNYEIPATSNRANMHATAVLVDQSTGVIVNADQISLTSVGVTEQQSTIAMEVYPNPSNGKLNVEFEGTGGLHLITITDLSGKVLKTTSLENAIGMQSVELGLDELKSGNYLISIANDQSSVTQHLVISK